MSENNAVQTALKTLLALYTEECAINSRREIDNDYLVLKLSSIIYSNYFITGYKTKKLLSGIRKHQELIRDFSNPNRILDVMNFLAVKDSLISLIQNHLKTSEEGKSLLLNLIKDFNNVKNTNVEISEQFVSSDIFNMLMGYILITELKQPLTLEDFIDMEEVKNGKISPKLLSNLDLILGYFNSLDIRPLENSKIEYRNFDKSVRVKRLSIRNRYKVRRNDKMN